MEFVMSECRAAVATLEPEVLNEEIWQWDQHQFSEEDGVDENYTATVDLSITQTIPATSLFWIDAREYDLFVLEFAPSAPSTIRLLISMDDVELPSLANFDLLREFQVDAGDMLTLRWGMSVNWMQIELPPNTISRCWMVKGKREGER